ncbi:hypothetical protein KAZ82_00350 [Candidatus Babeliales bacterium]|nr:hypothetical protein [Candidatus Babeliales bacterium]
MKRYAMSSLFFLVQSLAASDTVMKPTDHKAIESHRGYLGLVRQSTAKELSFEYQRTLGVIIYFKLSMANVEERLEDTNATINQLEKQINHNVGKIRVIRSQINELSTEYSDLFLFSNRKDEFSQESIKKLETKKINYKVELNNLKRDVQNLQQRVRQDEKLLNDDIVLNNAIRKMWNGYRCKIWLNEQAAYFLKKQLEFMRQSNGNNFSQSI